MRLDKYLKVSRLIKRRTVANEACDAGRVTINGKVARASAEVKVGDKITISLETRTWRWKYWMYRRPSTKRMWEISTGTFDIAKNSVLE